MDKVGLALDPKGDIKVESDLAIKVLDPSGDDLDSEPTLEKKKNPDPTIKETGSGSNSRKTRVQIRATLLAIRD